MVIELPVNPSFEQLDQHARYEFRGVQIQGRSIRAMLRRNALGVGAFFRAGLGGRPQVVELDEARCFQFKEAFNNLAHTQGYRELDRDNAYIFDRAGAWVQRAKLNGGIPLDCKQSSYVDSMMTVASYTDSE